MEVKINKEIRNYMFDYVFLASGTGTTQAGLICGKLQNNDPVNIIGISIARKNPRGRQVILESIRDYMGTVEKSDEATVFIDEYTGDGYGIGNNEIKKTIVEMLVNYGIPLDSTYTGKAFYGMKKYLEEQNIHGKKILFIHTGGTPLFFDDLLKIDCVNMEE